MCVTVPLSGLLCLSLAFLCGRCVCASAVLRFTTKDRLDLCLDAATVCSFFVHAPHDIMTFREKEENKAVYCCSSRDANNAAPASGASTTTTHLRTYTTRARFYSDISKASSLSPQEPFLVTSQPDALPPPFGAAAAAGIKNGINPRSHGRSRERTHVVCTTCDRLRRRTCVCVHPEASASLVGRFLLLLLLLLPLLLISARSLRASGCCCCWTRRRTRRRRQWCWRRKRGKRRSFVAAAAGYIRNTHNTATDKTRPTQGRRGGETWKERKTQ